MDTATVQCPYCGEPLDVFIDRSVPRQEYIEDCQVCCRPMTLVVSVDPDDDGAAYVDARSEEE
ncbi:MAG: CPXCG motif-containing cysteine-rich protein [Acidobacteria bacterium]|nr:CPXCG motif-containing cysteine-rich protein [Acidobacteriota bacterium]